MSSKTKDKKQKKSGKSAKGKHTGSGAPKSVKKKDRKLNAKNADRYDLYQRSVNSPETDVDFLTEVFEDLRGRPLRHLREDFCGTSLLSAEFLSRSPENTVEGADLDPEPMAWGQLRNFGKVEDGHSRMKFHLMDVRDRSDKRPDLTTAQNFSYFGFHDRATLLSYFKAVHADLADDGVFVMDHYGGPDSMVEMEEERDIEGAFTYVWDQKEYFPGSGEYKAAIHFDFRDGSRWENAFEYDWRLWFLTELKDVLMEAGFKEVRTYFEGTDPDDEEEGNGEFEYDPKGENVDAFIGYLVSLK